MHPGVAAACRRGQRPPHHWIGRAAVLGVALLVSGWQAPAEENSKPVAPGTPPAATEAFREQFDLGVRFMAERKYVGAAQAFERAAAAQTNSFPALSNWGMALLELGKERPLPQQRLEAFGGAAEKFAQAAALNPKEKTVLVYWGDALSLAGDLPLPPEQRLRCYSGALDRYRAAAALDPRAWEIQSKLGSLLLAKLVAFTENQDGRRQVCREAAGHFEKAAGAARASQDLGGIYTAWGEALLQEALSTSETPARGQLMREGIGKFERAAALVPGEAATQFQWGVGLIELAKLTNSRAEVRLAIDRLQAALELEPRALEAVYKLAVAYCLIDNSVMAVRQLEQCFKADPQNIYVTRALRDPDFDKLRALPDFQALVGTAGRANPAPGVTDRSR